MGTQRAGVTAVGSHPALETVLLFLHVIPDLPVHFPQALFLILQASEKSNHQTIKMSDGTQ